jgi:tRNA-modifying protein YgfZ
MLQKPAWRASVPESCSHDHQGRPQAGNQCAAMAMESLTEAMTGAPARAPGLLRFRGPDAVSFLQGQLSNDMTALAADRFMLAGLHSPQGRVLALLQLAAPEADHIVALLPAELAELTMATLRRYVLRAKLTISNESNAAALAALAAQIPAAAPVLQPEVRARAIAAGLPQVYATTSGACVAQMLNLDCVAGISFTKGCYTGQEIIARAHYRGRIKRRMQRFEAAAAIALAPGQAVTLSDGRTAQIVDAVERADGRTEFLAVTALHTVSEIGSAPGGSAESPATAPLRLDCRPLPLPYALPD